MSHNDACAPMPVDAYLHTHACAPMPARPCLHTHACAPMPARPCLRTHTCSRGSARTCALAHAPARMNCARAYDRLMRQHYGSLLLPTFFRRVATGNAER